ncbi:hypothetical protein OKA04_16045 [Luteolibacter flavescens]|uniref:NolW-like domain-containing protein n=1 Tax=Luteolibacter flavescens TaxID=1859460 RepID=A0ABT3FRR1_9BACT|nr:hypothetical protein [Luteolibacter flavescens]MCW1886250.1 hypothetical protein [Luteolibacter flavescens]
MLALSATAQEKPVPPPFEGDSPVEITDRAADDEDSTAEDPFDPDAIDGDTPVIVQVQVDYIEMSHEKLSDLLFMKRPKSADATELRSQVQAMVKDGNAKLLDTQVLAGRSGEKILVESIREQIYPTEAEPASVPDAIATPDKETPVSPAQINALANLVSGPTPTSFETRNVGSTLETEPTVGFDSKLIDLRISPELTWHTGNSRWYERKDALGNVATIEMPDFYTARLTTALTVTRGSYVLAGVVSPKSDKGATDLTRKVMIFVKADVLPVR